MLHVSSSALGAVAKPALARGWLPYVAILLAALAVTAPAILGPVRTNDSFWIDWVWLDQFASELAKGNFYPRWLPLSHDRLGSPVFYYYPPLAFYAGSIFVLAGLSTYSALIAAFVAAFALSGFGMYRWLRPQAQAPLLGAVIFVIAPYHAYNLYARGAIAETFATALLPFVMIGVRKLVARERNGFAITALTYAALITSHLPLALLSSIFLIGPYALIESWREPRRLAIIGSALALGIALAAIYLIPAIMLESYRDVTKLWHVALLRPSNWSFWDPQFRQAPNYTSVLLIGLAMATPLIALAIGRRSGWAAFGILCTILAVGIVPGVWSLPLLESVQFPFRLLPIAEFALASAMAISAPRPIWRVATCIVLCMITVPIASAKYRPVIAFSELRSRHLDVPENLPPGRRPYSWPSRWPLQVAATHRHVQYANGTTIVPVFYYPAWRVRCQGQVVRTFPEPGTKLLSYKGPPNCDRELAWTTPQKIGSVISLLALAGILMTFAKSHLHRKNVIGSGV